MDSFRVVCINDRSRPKEFPPECWIEKNEVYTVIDAKYLSRQNMAVGYKFAEIDIPEDCEYQYFLSNRFRPYNEDDAMTEDALMELLEETGFLEYA